MAEQIDQEIEAIKTVLKALEPLAAEVRTSVLEYVFDAFKLFCLLISAKASQMGRRGLLADSDRTKGWRSGAGGTDSHQGFKDRQESPLGD